MTTIVNNPAPSEGEGGNGFLIGVILVIVFVSALLYFGIPALKRMGPVNVNMPAPQINIPAPEVKIPDKINVETTPVPAQ